MAAEKKFPLSQIYLVDASKRTGHSNAAIIGFWKNQKILLYDTLLGVQNKVDD
jgi:STE24 endopeptidase